jgi:TetR/AcrR family transcriptional regulator
MMAAMQKTPRLSLRDLEQETKRFGAPATEKERSIIEAAVELIGERGIDGATTAEIARRAKVTERTLFRYFPSKRDLVRRVLFPLVLHGALAREWQKFETLLAAEAPDFKSWYAGFTAQRLAAIDKNPALVRALLMEVGQNAEFRGAIANLWRQHVWRPIIDGLTRLQARGAIRTDVDVEVLARSIHSLNVGYFFARYVFAPEGKWDDAAEIEKTAHILTQGAGAKP